MHDIFSSVCICDLDGLLQSDVFLNMQNKEIILTIEVQMMCNIRIFIFRVFSELPELLNWCKECFLNICTNKAPSNMRENLLCSNRVKIYLLCIGKRDSSNMLFKAVLGSSQNIFTGGRESYKFVVLNTEIFFRLYFFYM